MSCDEQREPSGDPCTVVGQDHLKWIPEAGNTIQKSPCVPVVEYCQQQQQDGTNRGLVESDCESDFSIAEKEHFDDYRDFDLEDWSPDNVPRPLTAASTTVEKEDWDKELDDAEPYDHDDIVRTGPETTVRSLPYAWREGTDYNPSYHHVAPMYRILEQSIPETGQFEDADG